MSRKNARVAAPTAPTGNWPDRTGPTGDRTANAATRARTEMEFPDAEMLGALFGQFDRNLVQIEDRLGVYISARGNRVQIEGSEEAVARTRDVLAGMQQQLLSGFELDAGAVDALIAMSSEPTLDGIVTGKDDNGLGGGLNRNGRPQIMIRTRKKTIAPRSKAQEAYMQALVSNDVIFALGPAGTGKTYLAVADRKSVV